MKSDVFRVLQHRLKIKRSTSHRRAGDNARDSLDWPAAEREYQLHLAWAPDDQPIWVQYGHSLKEQGKRNQAETAYRQAVTLRPQDADAHLQLAHMLKLLGHLAEAQATFSAAMELRPSREVFEELVDLDTPQLSRVSAGLPDADDADVTYLEIDDLLDYLKAYKTVSGIQRVQVGIILYAIEEMSQARGSYSLVRSDRHGSGLLRLEFGDIKAILDYLKQSSVTQARLVQLIQYAEQRARHVEPKKGQAYFVLGAFWGFGSNPARYCRLKQAGLSLGVYIYDLIPITHPEYCSSGLVSEFTLALGDGLHVFDFILTISEYVAEVVRGFIDRNGLRPRPVHAVRLAHRVHDEPVLLSAEAEAGAWQGAISALKDRPFVLVVCTIEPRKNHAYLYAMWKVFIDEGLDVPDLVFVGRFGWRVNDLRDMMIDTDFLGRRIHLLHDLSDVDLELLYRCCLFTAFPSIVEGWGLPVGEGLTHGRPGIASNATSVPEVGLDFVDYVDPWNVTGGIEVFKRLIFDGEYREERTRNIRSNFVPRTWDDVGRDLLGRLETLRRLPAAPYAPPLMKAGELLVPGDMTSAKRTSPNYVRRPLRPILAEGWYPAEHFGAWMLGHRGVLRFQTDCAPGTRIIAYMQLVGAPWSSDHMVTVCVGASLEGRQADTFPEPVRTASSPISVKAGTEFFCSASGVVEADGSTLVSFRVLGPDVTDHPALNVNDDRVFFLGLAKFTYAPASNTEMRADLFERFLGST